MKWPPIVELRQYTLRPGQRDTLIELFEANFVESQQEAGIALLGTFNDLDDESKFVWFRGFTSMHQRAQSLGDFYYGDVWKAHRDAANATMVDSDDVLLLNPLANGTAASMTVASAADGRAERGIAEALLLPLAKAADLHVLVEFQRRVMPELRGDGPDDDSRASVSTLGLLVTSDAENTFPALPVREGERFLIWLTGYRSRAIHDRFAPARNRALAAARGLSGLGGAPQVLRLEPTSRTAIVFPRTPADRTMEGASAA